MRGTVIRLGVFVGVCFAITIYLIFTIGNVQSLRLGPVQLLDDHYTLHATFDDASGLLTNDNVKVAGVVVGKVTGIHIEDGRAAVDFNVKKGMRLGTDTTAAIRWRNLLGQRYLYLYPGQGATVLRGGDRIAKAESVVDLGELFNRLGPIVKAIDPQKVNAFLDSIVGALDGNEANIRQAIDNLAVLAATLGERDQAIGRLVTNLDIVAGTITARDREIRAILDNLVAVATTFSANTDVLDRAITDLGTFTENFGPLLRDNRDNIDRVITNLRVLTDVVRAKLPTIDHALLNLDEGASRLFNASRFGEWLNQTIPCGALTYPNAIPVACTPIGSENSAPVAAAPRRGMAGLMQLMHGVVR